MRKLISLLLCISLLFPLSGFSLSDMELNQLVGYTEIGNFYATNNIEGSVYGQLLQLSNGMIFKFTDYTYLYAYSPQVTIFAHEYSLSEVQQINPDATTGFVAYKLIINDQVLNAIRIQ